MIPTNHGPMTPERVVDELMFANYTHNRNNGMSAASGIKFYPDGEFLEARYQTEKLIAKAGGLGL